MKYLVAWFIDIDDDVRTPTQAARAALKIQRDPDSGATVFDVQDTETGETWRVDLSVRPATTTHTSGSDYAHALSRLAREEL